MYEHIRTDMTKNRVIRKKVGEAPSATNKIKEAKLLVNIS